MSLTFPSARAGPGVEPASNPLWCAGENRADSRDDEGRFEKRALMIVRTVRA